MTPYERVLARSVPAEGGCLLWTGAKGEKGYGQMSVGGKRKAVHRVTYEYVKGPIPEGLEIDHLCRVRNCVNPAHLEAVTHHENRRRAGAAQTTCAQGHPYTEENTSIVHHKATPSRPARTARRCRLCHNEALVLARRDEARRRERRGSNG